MGARQSRIVNFSGGVLRIGVALYDLVQNWGMLRAFDF